MSKTATITARDLAAKKSKRKTAQSDVPCAVQFLFGKRYIGFTLPLPVILVLTLAVPR